MTGTELDIIFFDAGGTLLYPDPTVGEVYARVGRSRGIVADPKEMERVFHETFRRMPSGPQAQSHEWWQELVRRVFGHFGEIRDLVELRAELDRWFHSADAYRLFPGAREAIHALKHRGIRTGLISNWEVHLRGILIGLDLIPLLDPVIISAEVGAAKPDPEIYRAALTAAGVSPSRAVMVGDTPSADGWGAVSAGMHAVLIGAHETARPSRNGGSTSVATVPAVRKRHAESASAAKNPNVRNTDHPRIRTIEKIADLPEHLTRITD